DGTRRDHHDDDRRGAHHDDSRAANHDQHGDDSTADDHHDVAHVQRRGVPPVWRKLPRREALPTLRAHEILRLSVDGAESDRNRRVGPSVDAPVTTWARAWSRGPGIEEPA